MTNLKNSILYLSLLLSAIGWSQENSIQKQGHTNQNRFRQLYQEFSTPNTYRSASGTPGPNYYQQQADYKMAIKLEDETQKLYGEETITYYNNSPENLEYLWLQLDQNIREKNAKTKLIKNISLKRGFISPKQFVSKYLEKDFDGGFNIIYVVDDKGKPMSYTINQTMMRINLKKPLASGKKIKFSLKWWYNINNYINESGRSGYEYFEKDDNRLYIIAQFYPRMCVYNDVEGWQNSQFLGRGEFALTFGDYDVTISAPSDHILDGTGVLLNRKDVLGPKAYSRWQQATNSYKKPIIIITEDEAREKEKKKSTSYKSWHFKAENVRDFGFSSSRKFIYDAMAVNIGGKNIMAISMYPKEGNPLWEEYSTKAVAHTLNSYSKHTFGYPYPKAISVHARSQGMEYPMICWNYGRPDENGEYSDRVKFGMLSVIIHEVGHNFFPMIVNSDERQWTWMDEGLNSFLQYLTEQSFAKKYFSDLKEYPSRRGPAKNIIPYMKGNQNQMAPIMSQSEDIFSFGNNAYGKPATALNILREVVMGHELFDFAFKTYAQRWMFKHPTPEDLFRTMEDASAVDLDWFWRAWFYTTDYVDIGVKEVKTLYTTDEPNQKIEDYISKYNISRDDIPPLVYIIEENDSNFKEKLKEGGFIKHSKVLSDYIQKTYKDGIKQPKYLYEIVFEKLGGIPMPIIVEYTYDDGHQERLQYPEMIWRKNDATVSKVLTSDKKLIKIVIDPDEKTADIDPSNNIWPKEELPTEFDLFKSKVNKK